MNKQDFIKSNNEIDYVAYAIYLESEKEWFIKFLENKIEICDGFIDITKSDLEELKYTMFAHDKLKKAVDKNIKARNIYQDILEMVKSDNE